MDSWLSFPNSCTSSVAVIAHANIGSLLGFAEMEHLKNAAHDLGRAPLHVPEQRLVEVAVGILLKQTLTHAVCAYWTTPVA
jgi:hypothetical protein